MLVSIWLFQDVILVLEFILNIVYSFVKVASNTFSEVVPVRLGNHILLALFIVVFDDLVDVFCNEPLIIDWNLVVHLVSEMIIDFYLKAFWQQVVLWLCISGCQIRSRILVTCRFIF